MHKLLIPSALLLLAGCASAPVVHTGPTPVNTSLSSLMKDKGDSPLPAPAAAGPIKPLPTDRLTQNQPDIQAILDQDQPPTAQTTPEVTTETQPTPDAALAIEPASETALPPTAPPKTLAERIDEASLLLTDLLRQNTALSETPFQAALALAAMEAIRPGSAPKVITPDSVDGGALTDEQRDIVNAFRNLTAGLTVAASTDSDDLTERSTDLGNEFLRARPMRISAALAAKVTGFGQLIPLDAKKLQQGQPTKAIIYTEVKRFAQRPVKESESIAQPGDKYAVELSQEIQLIHDADGVKAWQRPEQVVVEASRSYRTDFYLVQNITLPQTLSIGAYKLKIIVRDKIGGHEDEVIIPLQVVADPTLVTESGKGLYD